MNNVSVCNRFTRTLSLLLCFIMVFSIMPCVKSSASAATTCKTLTEAQVTAAVEEYLGIIYPDGNQNKYWGSKNGTGIKALKKSADKKAYNDCLSTSEPNKSNSFKGIECNGFARYICDTLCFNMMAFGMRRQERILTEQIL